MAEIANGYFGTEQVPSFLGAYSCKQIWEVTSCEEIFSVKNKSVHSARHRYVLSRKDYHKTIFGSCHVEMFISGFARC
jgi:hypothetical protein